MDTINNPCRIALYRYVKFAKIFKRQESYISIIFTAEMKDLLNKIY